MIEGKPFLTKKVEGVHPFHFFGYFTSSNEYSLTPSIALTTFS